VCAGFYGKNSPHVNRNPGAPLSDWASKVPAKRDPLHNVACYVSCGAYRLGVWTQNGQDFPDNLASSSIDYVGIHVWPDNWLMKTPGFLQQFFRGHVEVSAPPRVRNPSPSVAPVQYTPSEVFGRLPQDSRYLGKPFVLEEFGKIVNATSDEDDMALRDTFFRAAYETAEEYALNDGIVQGTVRPLRVLCVVRESVVPLPTHTRIQHAPFILFTHSIEVDLNGGCDGAAVLALVRHRRRPRPLWAVVLG
jgi:hypothetical protein